LLKVKVTYRIEVPSERLAKALWKSLKPDASNLPEKCEVDISTSGKSVVVEISCVSISKLRALSNSFIGVLSLLLKVAGEA
jgi:tRNA threonylcarbamoyladenosine modification (KEOPS) complex  Pcc1 subunit